MYQAFYRKYRPVAFGDVCGQEHITSVLQYQTETGHVSHAYLFCGSRGTGKTTCAKILAKAVNCENPQHGDPCGCCASCRAIESGTATDVLEMDAASNNGVDYIRDIRDAVSYTPAMLKKRVYIIDEVHMLSTSAFNALLKTLEEPPEHVVFILATTELHKLPATIISRCQRFDFRRISMSVLCERLAFIAEKEGVVLESAAAQRIARQAQGGMRDAISLFELCTGGGAAVTEQRVEEILGLSNYESLCHTAVCLLRGDMKSLFEIFQEVTVSSRDIIVFWQELTSLYRDMMVVKYCAEPVDYLDLTEPELRLLQATAAQFSIQRLKYHSTVLDSALSNMQRIPAMKRTIAEFACLRMCEPKLDTSPEALLVRIEQLEDKIALLETGNFSVSPVSSEKTETLPTTAKKPSKVENQEKEEADPWIPIPDVSEFLEKLSALDKQTQSFMSSANLFVSEEADKCLIRCENEFSRRMLEKSSAQTSILRALTLCQIVSGPVQILVESGRTVAQESSVANELYE